MDVRLVLGCAILLESGLDAAEDAQIALVHEEAPALLDLEGEICLWQGATTQRHQDAQRKNGRLGVSIRGVDQDLGWASAERGWTGRCRAGRHGS